jgi:hypothetical protein
MIHTMHLNLTVKDALHPTMHTVVAEARYKAVEFFMPDFPEKSLEFKVHSSRNDGEIDTHYYVSV